MNYELFINIFSHFMGKQFHLYINFLIKNSYYGVTFFFNSHSLLIIIAKFIRL